MSSGVFSRFQVGQMVMLSVDQRLLLRNQENSKGQIHSDGGDHKLSAAAAFGAPIPNFGGGGGGGVLKNPAAAAPPARRRALHRQHQPAEGLHLRNSFNRPRRDGWLSWPCCLLLILSWPSFKYMLYHSNGLY